MNILQGIILGIFQGLTEFLPVSSSGHLILIQNLFGMENLEQYVFFDLVLHMGTLLAVLVVFFESIKSIILSRRMFILYIAIGVLALLPFHFAISFLKSFYDMPQYLGLFFIITALILLLGERAGKRKATSQPGRIVKIIQCAGISISQILAILPGVSRSGTTVSVARMMGWRSDEAAEYSFLLSVPVILMGSLYEGMKIFSGKAEGESVSFAICAVGFIAAFAVGVFALKLFLKLLERGKFKYFILYCLTLGTFCLVYFNFIK